MKNNNNRILAIIPARSGSKRLVGKNLKILNGKPLIEWTIDAALRSNVCETVIVSTDDLSIADAAKRAGAAVPFLRPERLAQDDSSSIDTVIHAIKHFKKQDKEFNSIMLLQPTSPLRTAQHIKQAVEVMNTKKADAVISVTLTQHSPLWSNTLEKNDSMESFLADNLKNTRSQDLSDYYRLNGAIYIVKIKQLLEEKSLFLSNNIYAYKMDRIDSVDIDEEVDFLLAETIFRRAK